MIEVRRGGLRLLVFEALERAGAVCAVSTAPLDVGRAPDRRRLATAVGLDPDRLVSTVQVHHAEVLPVAEPFPDAAPQADGLVTSTPGLPLLLRGADCSLVVVADPDRRTVGLAHAGWKGSARGVVVNLVRTLRERFGSDPARCLAGVGPTIGALRYPVGPRVPAAFLSRRPWAREFLRSIEGRLHFDLAGANARFLVESGIPSTAIEVCRLCTYDSAGLLHSFRRDGTGAGRHGMIAAWRR